MCFLSDKEITKELIIACSKNNRTAQKILYELCYRFLMPICSRFHSNEEDCRASFNAGFLKILNNLNSLEPDVSIFIAWSRRIMNNTLIDEYRKNKKYKERLSIRENERELDYLSTKPTNIAEDSFNEKAILNLLDYLNPTSKQVFLLYVIEGYNHKEIASLLQMSEGTSKWHLSIARKELRDMIEKLNKNQKTRIAI